MLLTDTAVRHAKPMSTTYSIHDSDGLSLFVAVNGRKSWHFRFSWKGKQCRISLGIYPDVGLHDARYLRNDAHRLLAKGIDPRVRRKQREVEGLGEVKFKVFVHDWLAFKLKKVYAQSSPERKNGGASATSIQIERYLRLDILPLLGDKPMNGITRADLLAVQIKIEARGALSIAEKVRGWLREIFGYAVGLGVIEFNLLF